ncbi:MAG TPA: hypothetical protein VF156_15500 [Agromyces sp.]
MNDAPPAPIDDAFLTPAERAAKNDEPMHLVLARDLIEKRATRDRLKAEKAEAEKAFQEAEARLNEYMVQHSMEPFRCDGHSVSAAFATRVNVLAANREPLIAALNANGFGSIVKTEPSVHASTLAAFVKEQRDPDTDELPEWLAGLVNVYDQPSINLRKVS